MLEEKQKPCVKHRIGCTTACVASFLAFYGITNWLTVVQPGQELEALCYELMAAFWIGLIGYSIGRLADKNAEPSSVPITGTEKRESVITLLDKETGESILSDGQ